MRRRRRRRLRRRRSMRTRRRRRRRRRRRWARNLLHCNFWKQNVPDLKLSDMDELEN